MNKKIIYTVLFIIIILIAGVAGYYYFVINSGKLAVNTQSGTVKVSNITKNPVETFSNSDIEYKKTNDYYLDYYAKDKLFVITIVNPDIQTARNKAEQDFLSTLRISQDEACQLNVQLGIPYSVNPDKAGLNFGLSFCPNGKAFN
jgi:hypothetical protein